MMNFQERSKGDQGSDITGASVDIFQSSAADALGDMAVPGADAALKEMAQDAEFNASCRELMSEIERICPLQGPSAVYKTQDFAGVQFYKVLPGYFRVFAGSGIWIFCAASDGNAYEVVSTKPSREGEEALSSLRDIVRAVQKAA